MKKYLEIAVVAIVAVAIANHIPMVQGLVNPAPKPAGK